MSKRTIVALALVAGLWWLRRDDPGAPPAHHAVQAAVLANGFALLTGPGNGHPRRVVQLDRDANRIDTMPLRLDREARLVDTRSGPGVGWQDGDKLKFGVLDSDGNPAKVSTWGKQVVQLCDGVATNEHRFGVGWLESDGGVWFVHGPVGARDLVTSTNANTRPTAPLGAKAKVTWCGIASAEDNVVLLWREGRRLLMNFCSRKQCSGFVIGLPIDPTHALLGYGCVRDSCLFAARDDQGTTRLYRVTERGRAMVRTLENATAETRVSIVGAGSRAFAAGYLANDGLATIHRVALDGSFTDVWHFQNTNVEGLAWAADRLLVALEPDDARVLAMPR